MTEQRFELLLDGVPYAVSATPFSYNSETRYRVQYNGNEHIFTWDSSMGRLSPIDDEAAQIPDNLEEAIALRLRNFSKI